MSYSPPKALFFPFRQLKMWKTRFRPSVSKRDPSFSRCGYRQILLLPITIDVSFNSTVSKKSFLLWVWENDNRPLTPILTAGTVNLPRRPLNVLSKIHQVFLFTFQRFSIFYFFHILFLFWFFYATWCVILGSRNLATKLFNYIKD